MQTSPDRAIGTLYRLTGLLRSVLRRTNGQFVSLREELEIVDAYLGIEHERFQERLDVRIDVPVELLAARIPPLMLQPLVENAVKHGIAPMRRGGRLVVDVEREIDGMGDATLSIRVVDTGKGLNRAASEPSLGLGLTNIENRLHHYFGGRASLDIRETVGGGTTVEIRMPWITAEAVVPAIPA
jgi:LytS/YehU family sensor histidine kinase